MALRTPGESTQPNGLSESVIKAESDKAEIANPSQDFNPLSGADPYAPSDKTVVGTQAFNDTWKNVNSTKEGLGLVNLVDGAINAKKAVESKTRNSVNGSPRPIHPYAEWMGSFGNNTTEVFSGILQAQERADLYAEIYKNNPKTKEILKSSPWLINDSIALGEALKLNGVIRSKQEFDFWRKHSGNKYSNAYGTNPYEFLRNDLIGDVPEKYADIASLPEKMRLSGKELDPSNPEDVKQFNEYRKHLDEKSSDLLEGAGMTVYTLAGALQKTVIGNIESLKEPQIDWQGDYIEPTGVKLTKKQNYLNLLNELASLEKSNFTEDQLSLDSKMDLLKRSKTSVELTDHDFDSVDPTDVNRKIPQIIAKIAAAHDELNADDAFSTDIWGVTAITTALSSLLSAGYGFIGFLHPEDPNAWLSRFPGSQINSIWSNFNGEKERLLNGKKFANDKERSDFLSTASQINRFNSAVFVHKSVNDKFQNGWFGDQFVDTRFHESESMVLDPFRGLGTAYRLSKGLSRGVGIFDKYWNHVDTQRRALAIEKIAELQRKTLSTFNVADSISGEARLQWNAAKGALEKAAGKPLTDAQILEEISKKKTKIPSVKDPNKLIEFPQSTLDEIFNGVNSRAKDVESLRRKAFNAVRKSRNGEFNYSANTIETLNLAREMLKKSDPNVNWDNVPDYNIYQRIQAGKVKYSDVSFSAKNSKVPITSDVSSWAKRVENAKNEVGIAWQKINTTDIAGFKRTNTLPIELTYGAARPIASGLNYSSRALRNWADSYERNIAKNLPNGESLTTAGTVLRDKNNTYIPSIASEASQNGSPKTLWYAKIIPSVLNTFASGIDIAEYTADFVNADGRISMYGSTFLGMYHDYNKQLKQLAKEKADIVGVEAKIEEVARLKAAGLPYEKLNLNEADLRTRGAYVNAEVELTRIAEKSKKLNEKMKWSKYLHSVGAAGLLRVGKFGSNTFISGSINEAIGLLGTSQSGAGIGGAFFFSGLNASAENALSGISRRSIIQERTNRDLYEIHSRLIQVDEVQQKNILQMLVKERKKADELGVSRLPEVGDQYFARSVSSLLYLLKTTNVEIRDDGVATGLMHIIKSTQHLEPQMQSELRTAFLKEADEKGIKGADATNYAERLIDGANESVNSGIRLGKISEEAEVLNTKKNLLLDETNRELHQYEQAVRNELASAGLKAENLSVDENGNVMYNGKPIASMTNNEITIKKVDILTKKYHDIRTARIARNKVIDGLTQQLLLLENEKNSLSSSNKIKPFRDGEASINTASGESIQSWGGGVHIIESNGESRVIISDNYNIGNAFEELNHALFYSESMKQVMPEINKALFGDWKLNENNEYIMTQEPIVKIEDIDSFVDAYTKNMDPQSASLYKAQYEIGKKIFESNRSDFRHLQPTIMEIVAAIYKGRMQELDPHQGRTEQFGSSFYGSVEMSPIQAGKSGAGIFTKFVFGSLTLNEWIRHKTGVEVQTNLAELNRLTPEQQATIGESIAGYYNLTKTFGANGLFDLMFKADRQRRLYDMGLMPRGNLSTDPQRFWNTAQMYDFASGKMVDIDPRFKSIIDSMINVTRNVNNNPNIDAVHDYVSVFNNIDKSDAKSMNGRIAWAYATGRRHWLEIGKDGKWTGNFKGPIADLIFKDRGPINDLFGRILDGNPEGLEGVTPDNYFGLKLDSALLGKDSKIVIGTPNKRQLKRVIDFLNEKTNRMEAGSMNEVEAITKFLTAIADNNHFDPDAANPGFTQMFAFLYQGDEEQLSPTSTKQQKVTKERLRVMTPIMPFIEENQTAWDGSKLPEKQASMYIWMLDEEQRIGRIRAATKGLLVDRNGRKYWNSDKIANVFGSEKNFAECVDMVLMNYSTSGSPVSSNKKHELPPRSWEVLLSKAGGNPRVAMHMADIINRTIGFPSKNFFEYTALLDKKESGVPLTMKEVERLDELRDKDFKLINGDRALAELQISPNKIGAAPMWSSNMMFTRVRTDRIMSAVVPYVDGQGRSKTPWTAYTWGLGDINYSGQSPWTPTSLNNSNFPQIKAMEQTIQGFERKGNVNLTVSGGLTHEPTGMQVVKATRTVRENGRDVSKDVYMVYDNRGNLISHTFSSKIKSLEEGTAFAEKYASENALRGKSTNIIEKALDEYGFYPLGLEATTGVRNTFVTPDGKYALVRVGGGKTLGSWNLIHRKTGAVVEDNIKIGYDPNNNVNVNNLVAAVINAEEGNKLNYAIERSRIEGITQELIDGKGLADWTLVSSGNKSKKILFARNNPVYYDFKRKLTLSVGHKYANEVIALMRKELGDDVIEKDFEAVSPDVAGGTHGNATISWIEDYTAKHHWDLEKMHEEIYRDINKDEAEARAAQQVIDAKNLGKTEGKLPKLQKPKPEDYETVEAFDYASTQYAQALANELHTNTFGDNTEAHARESLNDLLEWTKNLKTLQSKYTEKAKNTPVPIRVDSGEAIAKRLSELRGEIYGITESAETNIWVSGGGHIIQQLMYTKKPRFIGHEITVPRLDLIKHNPAFILAKEGVIGIERLMDKAFGRSPGKGKYDKMSKMADDVVDVRKHLTGQSAENSTFVVYTPRGHLIGYARSISEAQDLAAKDEKDKDDALIKQGAVIKNAVTEPKERRVPQKLPRNGK
jgi:hypothetical protein